MSKDEIDSAIRKLFDHAFILPLEQRDAFVAALPQDQQEPIHQLLNENAGIADAIKQMQNPKGNDLAETYLPPPPPMIQR